MKRDSLFKRHLGLLKVCLTLIFVILFILATGAGALAHKVNVFAYVDENTVFTESYFNDGRRCVDSKIEVFDAAGSKLLEGKTDKAGEFFFKIPRETDLRLVLTASMGHRAEYTVPASELSRSKPQPSRQEAPGAGIIEEKKMIAAEIAQVDLEEIKLIVEDALDKKLKPLAKLMVKSREHRVSITEVAGGIGYIIGIMGLVMYFRNRKR